MSPTLTLIKCDRKAMTLTQGACSKLWLSADTDKPARWEGRYACLGCSVGAAFNGRVIRGIDLAAETLSEVCPRCDRSGIRLIKKDLCVSCYNRDREARAERDRKGHRPILCDVLKVREIVVYQSGAHRRVRQRAASRDEIIRRMVKQATAPFSVGLLLPTWSWIGPQAVFGFGALPRRSPGLATSKRRGPIACEVFAARQMPLPISAAC